MLFCAETGAKVRRRQFLLLFGAAAAWPSVVRAQQPATPIIGFMSGRSPDDSSHLVAAFHRGLGETGFVEGKNVTIEYRWALGQYDRLPALAAELVKRPVTILVAVGGDVSAVAEEGNVDDPRRFWNGGRSHQGWTGRYSWAARRKCDRLYIVDERTGTKAPGPAARPFA